MAGAAQRDRAAPDARGNPSGCVHTPGGRPVRRCRKWFPPHGMPLLRCSRKTIFQSFTRTAVRLPIVVPIEKLLARRFLHLTSGFMAWYAHESSRNCTPLKTCVISGELQEVRKAGAAPLCGELGETLLRTCR